MACELERNCTITKYTCTYLDRRQYYTKLYIVFATDNKYIQHAFAGAQNVFSSSQLVSSTNARVKIVQYRILKLNTGVMSLHLTQVLQIAGSKNFASTC